MYPSSISRALCSDGMRCIKPLAPSRNETNSSRVNVGADGVAILGNMRADGGHDQAGFSAGSVFGCVRDVGLIGSPTGHIREMEHDARCELCGTVLKPWNPNAHDTLIMTKYGADRKAS
jgi:hypothetical protein